VHSSQAAARRAAWNRPGSAGLVLDVRVLIQQMRRCAAAAILIGIKSVSVRARYK
jgi:hypothetical protein